MKGIFDDNTPTNFIFTNAAWMVLATNGSLSAASSVLIMSIILRSSPESRTSAYHIIMFFMSFWDTIVSVAMALNTIPMPYDVHEIYPFAGKALGNIGTCEVQGFLIWMGTLLILGSNTTLNLYYVCTMRYGMAEENFKKRILPFMLVLFTAVSIKIPMKALRMDLFNPSPIRGFCFVNPYPCDCIYNYHENEGEEGINCVRGEIFHTDSYRRRGLMFIGAAFLILVVSLILVVVTVFDAEVAIRRSRSIRRRSGMSNLIRRRAALREVQFKTTRAILTQALMYISAFLLTYVWTIIIVARKKEYSITLPSNTMSFLFVFFPPLQGFFNAIIFVYQKVYTLRQTNAGLNFFQALKQVIQSPSTVPQALVSRLEIIDEQIVARNPWMRQFGRGNGSTEASISIASGVGSSSLDFSIAISLGEMSLEDFIGMATEDRNKCSREDRLRSAPFNPLTICPSPSSIISGVGSSSVDSANAQSSRDDTSVDENNIGTQAISLDDGIVQLATNSSDWAGTSTLGPSGSGGVHDK